MLNQLRSEGKLVWSIPTPSDFSGEWGASENLSMTSFLLNRESLTVGCPTRLSKGKSRAVPCVLPRRIIYYFRRLYTLDLNRNQLVF